LYFSVIRPVVTYAFETWILKETITNRLIVFERKILRTISGTTYENGSWRVKTNEELDKLIKHENIINFARAERYGILKECKKDEWSKQYTPGNPFQRGQWGDQRYAGRMILKKIYRG